ncbi:MAG: hypothetical protein EOL87_11290 [Spartobacteria bacterium]|nr:hypothetical protein [Spartobacteria bacterium]
MWQRVYSRGDTALLCADKEERRGGTTHREPPPIVVVSLLQSGAASYRRCHTHSKAAVSPRKLVVTAFQRETIDE